MTIEGRRALVTERRPPLPGNLAQLLGEMRITFRSPVRIAGFRSACADQDHRLIPFAEGIHVGTDGRTRFLRLSQCADCEAVQVRDASLDRLSGLPAGSLAIRRRDLILAWYSGARRAGRTYA